MSLFFQDTDAYIPYSIIGIFIVLAATFTSVYLLNMDSEIAEIIYTIEKSDPRQTAINLAAAIPAFSPAGAFSSCVGFCHVQKEVKEVNFELG